MGHRFSACFVLKFHSRGKGEKGRNANFKTKHTEPDPRITFNPVQGSLNTKRQRSLPFLFLFKSWEDIWKFSLRQGERQYPRDNPVRPAAAGEKQHNIREQCRLYFATVAVSARLIRSNVTLLAFCRKSRDFAHPAKLGESGGV